MKVAKYKLKLTLRSPFLIPSTQINKWGHDVSQITNDDGYALIPGDLIKGMMRHAMRAIGKHAGNNNLTVRLFGQEPDEMVDESRRGRVVISDLTTVEKPDLQQQEQAINTRVHISRETGAAETGHLQFMEQLYPSGKQVVFIGELTLLDGCEGDIDWLKKALAVIPAIGANKSSGYGEVCKAELIEKESKPVKKVEINLDYVTFRLTFDRPILIDNERIAGNVFQSREVIPGSVIKGALAAALDGSLYEKHSTLNEDLSRIRFGFAYPKYMGDFHYPPLPLSLMISPDDKTGETLFDAACYPFDKEPGPLVVGEEIPSQLQKAKKRVRAAALKKLQRNYPPLPKEVRVRTAIDSALNTAKEGLIFSYAMVKPEAKGNRVEWYGRIDRNDANAVVFKDLMSRLQDGLPRVGKTEAWGSVEIVEDGTKEAQSLDSALSLPGRSEGRFLTLQLITPALMIDPQPEKTAAEGLIAQYQQYWSKIGSLNLVQIFTKERLIGGFSANTYRFREDDRYHPYVLTEAGSVFVFDHSGGEEMLRKWKYSGLPLPDWVEKRDFNIANGRIACPYVPENGYGAFILNPSDQLLLESPQNVGVIHVR